MGDGGAVGEAVGTVVGVGVRAAVGTGDWPGVAVATSFAGLHPVRHATAINAMLGSQIVRRAITNIFSVP